MTVMCIQLDKNFGLQWVDDKVQGPMCQSVLAVLVL